MYKEFKREREKERCRNTPKNLIDGLETKRNSG
jgi:hypothetical protein